MRFTSGDETCSRRASPHPASAGPTRGSWRSSTAFPVGPGVPVPVWHTRRPRPSRASRRTPLVAGLSLLLGLVAGSTALQAAPILTIGLYDASLDPEQLRAVPAVSSKVPEVFTVSGTGTVFRGTIGIPGERVEFSFSYSLSDFADAIFQGPFAVYNALTPVVVRAHGSLSGSISGIDPIRRVEVLSIPGLDFWSFENGSTSAITSPLEARNGDGTAFGDPPPSSFADAHSIFLKDHRDPLIWQVEPSGFFFANNATDELSLTDIHWRIPEPGIGLLVAASLAGLAIGRWPN